MVKLAFTPDPPKMEVPRSQAKPNVSINVERFQRKAGEEEENISPLKRHWDTILEALNRIKGRLDGSGGAMARVLNMYLSKELGFLQDELATMLEIVSEQRGEMFNIGKMIQYCQPVDGMGPLKLTNLMDVAEQKIRKACAIFLPRSCNLFDIKNQLIAFASFFGKHKRTCQSLSQKYESLVVGSERLALIYEAFKDMVTDLVVDFLCPASKKAMNALRSESSLARHPSDRKPHIKRLKIVLISVEKMGRIFAFSEEDIGRNGEMSAAAYIQKLSMFSNIVDMYISGEPLCSQMTSGKTARGPVKSGSFANTCKKQNGYQGLLPLQQTYLKLPEIAGVLAGLLSVTCTIYLRNAGVLRITNSHESNYMKNDRMTLALVMKKLRFQRRVLKLLLEKNIMLAELETFKEGKVIRRVKRKAPTSASEGGGESSNATQKREEMPSSKNGVRKEDVKVPNEGITKETPQRKHFPTENIDVETEAAKPTDGSQDNPPQNLKKETEQPKAKGGRNNKKKKKKKKGNFKW